jgi:hypothetical protein
MDPMAPYPGAPQRWTADSEAAKHTIPYLGPQPPPSQTWAIPVQIACGALALLYVVKAAVFLWQARVEQDWLDDPLSSTVNPARPAVLVMSALDVLGLLLAIVFIVLTIVWRIERRPKRVRNDLGEAYVELPLKWLISPGMRAIWVAGLVIGYMLHNAGAVNASTSPTDYPQHRVLLALANLAATATATAYVVWVEPVKRSHERRVAWSWPYRADAVPVPAPVPFFPAVAGSGYGGNERGPRSRSGGIGWALRTSGLIMLIFIGVVALWGGTVEIANGRADGFPWFAAGVLMNGFVVWVMVRRYRLGKL